MTDDWRKQIVETNWFCKECNCIMANSSTADKKLAGELHKEMGHHITELVSLPLGVVETLLAEKRSELSRAHNSFSSLASGTEKLNRENEGLQKQLAEKDAEIARLEKGNPMSANTAFHLAKAVLTRYSEAGLDEVADDIILDLDIAFLGDRWGFGKEDRAARLKERLRR